MLEEFRGVAFRFLGNLLGGTYGEYLSTVSTAFGTHIDDPVGKFDDIEVVLDDDNRVAAIHEFLEYVHQDADVLEVKARGGLVEDVECLARIFLRQFGGQFYALTLTSGEGGGMSGTFSKNSTAWLMVMSSTSAIDLPLKRTSSVSRL